MAKRQKRRKKQYPHKSEQQQQQKQSFFHRLFGFLFGKRKKLQGTVKWFNNKKGFGFIDMKDGDEIFVHHSSISMRGFRSLEDGDAVEFEIEDTKKGRQAVRVKKI